MAGSMTRAALRDICEQVTDGTHDSPKLRPCGVPLYQGEAHLRGPYRFWQLRFHLRTRSCAGNTSGQTPNGRHFAIQHWLYRKCGVRQPLTSSLVSRTWHFFERIAVRFLHVIFTIIVTSRQFQNEITSKRSGVAQPFIALETIRDHEITFHSDLTIQRRIEGILSAYDDLIENNLRRIAILEEMAQAIYREWFVEFRYPGHRSVKIGGSTPV